MAQISNDALVLLKNPLVYLRKLLKEDLSKEGVELSFYLPIDKSSTLNHLLCEDLDLRVISHLTQDQSNNLPPSSAHLIHHWLYI